MDIKRTLLWAVLTISGLMLYNNWLLYDGRQALFGPTPLTPNVSKPPEPKETPSGTPAVANPATPQASAAPPSAADLPKQANLPKPEQGPSISVTNLTTGEKHSIKNEVLELEISATGASVINAKLLKQLGVDKKPITLLQITPQNQYFVRSGLISATSNDLPNHTATFVLSKSGRVDNKNFISFISEKGGVRLEKTFFLSDGSYVVEVEHRVTQIGAQGAANLLVLYSELVRDGTAVSDSEFYSTFTGPALYTDKEKFTKIDFSDIEKNKVTMPRQIPAGEPGWIAMVQHYFASAWLPSDKTVRDVYVGKVEQNLYRIGLQTPLAPLAAGASHIEKTRLFIGPQEETLLEKIAPGFDLIKDYGYLTVIAKPIFWLLEQIHSYVANWGWAIVILTLLIKLLFFPLSAASYKSMARMKEVQPRLMTLREQLKGDPQKLNRAMMDLYKQEKINPLGGCLPVVVQIPVFIALYWVLLSSVEMRNAPWILWINDLSVPDPYYILPVIMAVSMYVQVKLNPTPPDPLQAKIMMWMPIVFSVMFFFFPAGLVLYWVVNNILSIAQQWQINQMFAKRSANK
ncbi:MAG: membrane protein insertase YidC [Burkholderiaceae bacterium]|jgi:YidC/Oxa1 family membrane protein insertase|nr:membrane protein insertase YidC [Burkholderiaceae bacterium]